jgi:hypothetical protein
MKPHRARPGRCVFPNRAIQAAARSAARRRGTERCAQHRASSSRELPLAAARSEASTALIHDVHYVTGVLDPKTIESGIGANEICTCIGRFAPIMRVDDRHKLTIVTDWTNRSQQHLVVFYVEGNTPYLC